MSDPIRARVSGPLLPYVAGFRDELAGQGYRPGSVTGHLQLLAHVSRWMSSQGLEPADLTPVEVERSASERRSQGYEQRRSSRALQPLLGYLRGLGVVPVASREVPAPLARLVGRYERYLVDARGLAPSTTARYVSVARAFLAGKAGQGDELCLEDLDARYAIELVGREARRLAPGSAKDLVTSLRSFLRFLHAAGTAPAGLADALPTVAVWGGGSLPRALRPEQVEALLGSCDQGSVAGRRDFAVLKVLARLGLRAGEVAGMLLEDFDWRLGELVVRGKGHRVDRMPVPVDVGEAVTGYLRGGRPPVECRAVFLRVCAPIVGLSPMGVSNLVMRACERAGLAACGAHRLRHSVATSTLRAGGSLGEVGQLLRHRSGPATTATYAKVDWSTLRSVAQPWPTGGAA